MVRKKSDVLGALIFKAIADAVIARGGNDDDLRRVVGEEGLAGKIAEVIIAGRTATNILEVNYDMALEAMVAAGHYNYRNSDITSERFPSKATGVKRYEPVLVHLDRSAATEEALAEIQQLGLVPASLAELLVYGAKNPKEQRKYPIVALGQSWTDPDGHPYFPFLWVVHIERYLCLRHYNGDWGDSCRFLALRKISS